MNAGLALCKKARIEEDDDDNVVVAGTFENIPQGLLVPFVEFDLSDGRGYVYPLSEYESLLKDYTRDGLIFEATPSSYYKFITAPKPAQSLQHPFQWNATPAIEETRRNIMPHQKDAIDVVIMDHNGRSLVAFPPGDGKTLVGCLYAFHYKTPALFIVPANKGRDWVKALMRWTGIENSQIQLIDKGNEVRKRLWVVCSYEKVKVNESLLSEAWNSVVVDECHMLKHSLTQRSQAIVPLLQRTPAVLLLSGTPQENRTAELFNPLHALFPKVFNNRQVFTQRYSNGHMNRFNVWEESGSRNLDELHLLLNRCMFRVTNPAVGRNLPPLLRHLVHIEVNDPNGVYAKQIDALKDEASMLCERYNAENDKKKSEMIQRQRETVANKIWALAGTTKASECEEIIKRIVARHPRENIVFFAHHQTTIQTLYDTLKTLFGTERVITITGDVPVAKRDALLESIIRTPEGVEGECEKYAVLTMKTCGVGIDLVPGVSVIVFFELERSPSDMEQAEGRAWRKGAIAKQVSTYWLLLFIGNDASLLKRLQFRKSANAQVIDGKKHQKFVFDDTIHMNLKLKKTVMDDGGGGKRLKM